ncbi:MAG: InlB B-repeat-containing protein, partial [Bacilli bacterium]|nr:InlB B-repeat-containing protein [Bacilli bacterium]
MNKKRGFTLVELLATIVVLALIFSITIFIATNLIKKNKENTYKVTINEIESNASNYLIENSGRLFYLTKDENTEYQCITVENLVDYGYLDNNITNSLVSDNVNVKKTDYIYIERDSATKTVTKTIYVSNNSDTKKTCDKAVIALGDIVFTYSPALNTWSRYKDITITYRLRNLNDQRELDNYLFNHSFNGTSSYDKNNDTLINNIKTKKIRITSKGILMASITYDNEELAKKSQNITKIDTTAPKIAKGTYTGENTVRSTVTIPLTVTDSESGVDYKSFTNDDLVVKVGTTTVKDYTLTHGTGDNYSLKINSDLYDGKVVLTIAKDKVLDKVLNGNEDTTIDTGITFDNTYKITYNANGGSGAPKATTYKYATSGNTNITSDKPTKTGYTFLGWAETSTATKVKYKSGDVYSKNIKKDITLYALWVINKVYVKYHINGGTWAGSTNTHLNVANSYVTYDKSADAFVTNYGGTINLADWNNSSYINIKRTGHTPKKGYEWCTKSDGTGNCYNQSTDYTKVGTDTAASHFCDARTVSCTVTLYANWVANTYKITYNANGGSGAPSATTYTYATSGTVSLSSAIPTRKGYIFLGWAESSSATNAKYQTGDIYSKGIDKNVTLYAVWSTDTFFDGVGHYGFAIAGSNSASRGESREKASATSKWVVAPPTDSRYNNVLASLK